MKTVKINTTKEVERVSNERAEELVGSGSARYVPKSEWKATRKNKLPKEKDEKAN
jgi:hypothetical protein